MSITLGKFRYPRPVVVLAPMAGISDLPFRRLCQENGADFTVAEMISAKPDLLNTPEAIRRLSFDDNPRYPKIVQLLGADPALMAEAAQLMQAKGADIIDINMGCPAKTVAKQQAGSALLADLKQAERILRAVVNAVKIPVTLKTRLGVNPHNINLSEVGKMAVASGIALITVHGRTRAQKFTGNADFKAIAALKNISPIPVIANGDIHNAQRACELIARYGFDGVMIGRAAQGNPWLFAQCQQQINGITPAKVMPHEQICRHIQQLHAHYGKHATYIARQHLHAYFRLDPAYPSLRRYINRAPDYHSQLHLLSLAKRAQQ